VLHETTSRGLCELVCPSRTSERGGEGYCVKEGGGEEGVSAWVRIRAHSDLRKEHAASCHVLLHRALRTEPAGTTLTHTP
jgi:hypothetical protein